MQEDVIRKGGHVTAFIVPVNEPIIISLLTSGIPQILMTKFTSL